MQLIRCEDIYIMIRLTLSLLRNENGASAAEYVLILAVIGSGLAGTAVVLGDTIGTAIERTAAVISSSGEK